MTEMSVPSPFDPSDRRGFLLTDNDSESEIGNEFQREVYRWVKECMGRTTAMDKWERSARFLEEALELVQASGMAKEDVLRLVDYTYGREPGEVKEEVGQVIVTLAALCTAHSVNLDNSAESEINRVWMRIHKIREKHRGKPRNSPLPGDYPPSE